MYSMNERLEQLLQLKKMCLNELKQAQATCQRYSSNMTVLAEYMNANWHGTKTLTEFDTFITNMTTIMDATRKFNLHVHFNNMKLSEMYSLFSKVDGKESQSVSVRMATVSPKEISSNFHPAEEYDPGSEIVDDFVYPKLNLSEVYKENEIISGTVTHIKSLKDLSFYIFDNSSKYLTAMIELSKTLDLRQYHDMPSICEVFGCVLDNHIFRAVLGSKTLDDVEMNEKISPCYILDTGEILPLRSGHVMYRLTNDQKNIPGLALHCQLKSDKNPFLSKEYLENKLEAIEYKKCNLRVLAIEGNTLHMEIVDNAKDINTALHSEKQQINISLKAEPTKTKWKQLTEEEINMINEEPLNTTNAMKAVMGYDPQDDKRICRFYNPSTGGCFKGVNCRLEHTLQQADGWTKDITPTTSIIDSHPITVFAAESIINITPTYVGQLDRFFAQINDPCNTNHPLVWNEEDVPSSKVLRKSPHMFELVLSRYVDGLWYRAKIMSHDDDYKMFKVFYVDYGNIQVVHLHNLATIEASTAQLPFQAVLCRLEHVNEKPSISADERRNCIEILCDMILNKSMDVKVGSHYEDLFISFVDKKAYPLPDVLIEMGYLEINKNKILL